MKTHRIKPVVLNKITDDAHLFRETPKPRGNAPYRLNMERVIPCGEGMNRRMQFHMVGDTGSVRAPEFQRIVAGEMAKQVHHAAGGDLPAFLFHLGDVVYNHGEAHEYPGQFFEPYENYPAPIFAIAGNHDADVNPASQNNYRSLDAFMDVFCDMAPRHISFSAGSKRQSMIQPYVYWTLQTPLANIIGLYGNATKFGTITGDQADWFVRELQDADRARPGKALIVCVHQPPFSADTNHGSSVNMIAFLENAYIRAGVKPDIVFSGHVHNYQRFSKTYADGTVIPYIVAGAGGYADLHHIAQPDDISVADDLSAFRNVRLENYCDNKHGFLKIGIEKTAEGLLITGEYYSIHPGARESIPTKAVLYERFYVPLGYREYSLMDWSEGVHSVLMTR